MKITPAEHVAVIRKIQLELQAQLTTLKPHINNVGVDIMSNYYAEHFRTLEQMAEEGEHCMPIYYTLKAVVNMAEQFNSLGHHVLAADVLLYGLAYLVPDVAAALAKQLNQKHVALTDWFTGQGSLPGRK